MAKHTYVDLPTEQRAVLEQLIHSGNAPGRTQTRARILLLADRSQGPQRADQEIAVALLCHKGTVRNVRHRFQRDGLQAALHDKPRPGQKPKITGEIEAQLTVLACSDRPAGHARWTFLPTLPSPYESSAGRVGKTLAGRQDDRVGPY